jgi:hypothetical protein
MLRTDNFKLSRKPGGRASATKRLQGMTKKERSAYMSGIRRKGIEKQKNFLKGISGS